MTVLFYGDRLEVGDALGKIPELQRVQPPIKGDPRKPADIELAYVMAWKARSLPPRPLVFIDPPKTLDPEDLTPRGDRLVAFFDDKLPAPWAAWAKAHKQAITVTHCARRDPKLIIGALVEGRIKGFPRFQRAAAAHLVAANCGNPEAIKAAVAYLMDCELPTPFRLEDVVAVWPHVPAEGRVYAVNLGQLLRALGKPEAMRLVRGLDADNANSALRGLQTACKNQTFRIQLIQILIDGVYARRWEAPIALFLFTYLCFQEAQCPSSTETPSGSPTLTSLFQLFDIPFSPSS